VAQHIARRFAHRGEPLDDLVQVATVGLINAIERYEPSREIEFETYAVTRIKGAIIDELRSLDWVPRSVRARAREIGIPDAPGPIYRNIQLQFLR